jgi:transposase
MSPNLELNLMTILFKIQGYQAKEIIFDKKKKRILIEIDPIESSSKKSCLYPHTRYDSTIQYILIGAVLGNPVYAKLKVYRTKCSYCGIKTEKQTISEGKRRYSKAMELEVLKHTELMDNKSVSRLLNISESTVYRIDYNGLTDILEVYEKKIQAPSTICVDEVSYKRRHKYATVLTDYHDAKVIWVEEGRKAIDLKSAYKKFGDTIKNVETVCSDFWPAYLKATKEKIPFGRIVFDRFHLSRLLNKKVEDERRIYQKELSKEEKKQLKKNCRWLILKRKSNLTAKNISYLEQLKKENEPLYNLYLLKESFLNIYDPEKDRDTAEREIIEWTEIIFNSKFKKLKVFARSVLKRLELLLNWFDQPISNAKSEGINNVIKSLLKRSYGFKNFDYFRVKVLQKCGNLMEHLPREI